MKVLIMKNNISGENVTSSLKLNMPERIIYCLKRVKKNIENRNIKKVSNIIFLSKLDANSFKFDCEITLDLTQNLPMRTKFLVQRNNGGSLTELGLIPGYRTPDYNTHKLTTRPRQFLVQF